MRHSNISLFGAITCTLLATAALPCSANPAVSSEQLGNREQRVEEFMDLGLGLFIHWSVDVQYGAVISHSLVGADETYRRRYFEESPKTFNPIDYDPARWAELARACGFRYGMLTAKHHNGFCLFPTETTDFDIESARYGKDLVAPYAKAFRKEGLWVGLYFSPEDFWMLNKQGHPPAREAEYGYTQTSQNPELNQHCLKQIEELHRLCSPVDAWFFDSLEAPADIKQAVWKDNPNTVVTRGAMETPEQNFEGVPSGQPWEACFTMGDQWQYRGTNEHYKDGTELIQLLIQTRARGGNLLLNIGPDAYGRIPPEQEALMREMGLWLLVNGEAIYGVRPWRTSHEGDVWFTQSKDSKAVYLFMTGDPEWAFAERREFDVESVRLSVDSEVSVLGHDGKIVEYDRDTDPTPRAVQEENTLRLSVMRAQRLYNDRRWPNPIVIKVTNPALPIGQ